MTLSSTRSTVFILFGGHGDLSWRKLIPSLFSLFVEAQLPEHFEILIVGRSVPEDVALREYLQDGAARFSRFSGSIDRYWNDFASHVVAFKGDFNEASFFDDLKKRLEQLDQAWQTAAGWIFYMATPPSTFGKIATMLGESGLAQDAAHARLVVEKPIGYDLDSAKILDRTLEKHFQESQIFRIDHYLGKETVQNILVFRFANPMFEPVWNRRYIEYVTLTVAEEEGVGTRAGYYEHAGALRDMVQNHMMQLLCLVAMEPPVSFDADEIRNKKVDVLRAIRPIPPDQVSQYAARGQYRSGWIKGRQVCAYREEENVSPHSNTETFAALKLFVDNWRWQDIPFYMRTGKCMPERYSEISIHFRGVPHKSFPSDAAFDWQPSRLVINIQPHEGIIMTLQAKQPGSEIHMQTVDMHFCYNETFKTPSPEAYETLLSDIIRGDQTLFMRADQIAVSWAVLMPVLQAWQKMTPPDFPNYAAGTAGPVGAEYLITQDGRNWPSPMIFESEACQPPRQAEPVKSA